MSRNTDKVKRDVNFFAELKRAETVKTHVVNRMRLTVIGIAAAALLCAGGYGMSLFFDIQQNTKAIAVMKDYLEDEGNQASYQVMSRLQDSVMALRSYNRTCQTYIDQLKEVPRVDSLNFKDVYGQLPEEVRITAYNYSDPNLSIECITSDKDAPARFAKNLSNSGLFKTVSYEGFSSQNNLSGKDYTFQIQCALW